MEKRARKGRFNPLYDTFDPQHYYNAINQKDYLVSVKKHVNLIFFLKKY